MDQQPVYTFAKWQVKKGNLEEVLQLLAGVTAQSRKEEGNFIYKIHQSRSDPHTLLLFEGYKDQDALDAHRNSSHFRSIVIEKIIPLLEEREVIITSLLEPDQLK